MKTATLLPLLLAWAGVLQPAMAELQGRSLDGDAVIDAYLDTATQTLWHKNAGASGLVNFASAQSWVAGLVVAGNSNWRLPTIEELESVYGATLENFGSISAGPFTGVGVRYWSTTPLVYHNWTLDTRNGLRYEHSRVNPGLDMSAWAVQTVPEPSSMLMGVVGLFGVLVASRRARN